MVAIMFERTTPNNIRLMQDDALKALALAMPLIILGEVLALLITNQDKALFEQVRDTTYNDLIGQNATTLPYNNPYPANLNRHGLTELAIMVSVVCGNMMSVYYWTLISYLGFRDIEKYALKLLTCFGLSFLYAGLKNMLSQGVVTLAQHQAYYEAYSAICNHTRIVGCEAYYLDHPIVGPYRQGADLAGSEGWYVLIHVLAVVVPGALISAVSQYCRYPAYYHEEDYYPGQWAYYEWNDLDLERLERCVKLYILDLLLKQLIKQADGKQEVQGVIRAVADAIVGHRRWARQKQNLFQAKLSEYQTSRGLLIAVPKLERELVDDSGVEDLPAYLAKLQRLIDVLANFFDIPSIADIKLFLLIDALGSHHSRKVKDVLLLALLLKFGQLNSNATFATELCGGPEYLYCREDAEIQRIMSNVLLNAEADHCAVDAQGRTLLLNAVEYSNLDALYWLCWCTQDCSIQSSNRRIPIINFQDHAGCSALHFAANLIDIERIKILLRYNAAVNLTDNRQATPLHYLFRSYRPGLAIRTTYQCARALLNAGANLGCVDADGRTPVSYISSGLAELMRYALHDVVSSDASKLLVWLKAGVNANVQCVNGDNLLHILFREFSINAHTMAIAAILLKYGADPYLLNAYGCTAVDYIQDKELQRSFVRDIAWQRRKSLLLLYNKELQERSASSAEAATELSCT
jgi:ankyrin repeat protein